MAELTYYEDDNVRITNQSVKSDRNSYRLSDISWAGINLRTESRLYEKYGERIQLIVIALLMFGLYGGLSFPPPTADWQVLLFCIYVSVILLSMSVLGILPLIGESHYYILLEGTFGRAEILTSTNRQYILNILGHINTVILEKRKKEAPWTLLPNR